MRSKENGHDFLSRYLFFGLCLSFFLWLFTYEIKGGDLSSLFFSSLNLLFNYQLFIFSPTSASHFGKTKLYFYELILGQFLFSCFVFYSGVKYYIFANIEDDHVREQTMFFLFLRAKYNSDQSVSILLFSFTKYEY